MTTKYHRPTTTGLNNVRRDCRGFAQNAANVIKLHHLTSPYEHERCFS